MGYPTKKGGSFCELSTPEIFPHRSGGTEHHPGGGAAVYLSAVPVQPHRQSGAGAGREAVYPVPQAVADLRGGTAGGHRHRDPGPAPAVPVQGGGHQQAVCGGPAGGHLPHLRAGPSARCAAQIPSGVPPGGVFPVRGQLQPAGGRAGPRPDRPDYLLSAHHHGGGDHRPTDGTAADDGGAQNLHRPPLRGTGGGGPEAVRPGGGHPGL